MPLITHKGVFWAMRNLAFKKKAVSARLIFKVRLIRKYVVVLAMNSLFNSSGHTR